MKVVPCVHFSKSKVFFSANTNVDDQTEVTRVLGIQRSSNSKSMRLPNVVGKGRKASFQFIKDKIKVRLDSWSNIVLSQGGKEIFVKSVLRTVSSYTISYFLMPESFCRELKSIFAHYW